jgi:predicted  nucleic acid-binding Zn-ribbon protein
LRGLKKARQTAVTNSTRPAAQSCNWCKERPAVANENSRHALGMAQKLSDQLRAAEDRIAELEAEVTAYQQRAERAEQWLHRVYTEIEDRFLQQSDKPRAMNGAPQRPQNARRSR